MLKGVVSNSERSMARFRIGEKDGEGESRSLSRCVSVHVSGVRRDGGRPWPEM